MFEDNVCTPVLWSIPAAMDGFALLFGLENVAWQKGVNRFGEPGWKPLQQPIEAVPWGFPEQSLLIRFMIFVFAEHLYADRQGPCRQLPLSFD